VALALWAGGHMLANGDLAHVALFGLFVIFALLGQRIVDRRRKRALGPAWARLDAVRRAGPLWPPRPASVRGGLGRVVPGLLAWGVLVVLHPYFIGVSPLP
jgi:uncharacterized membrane protein